MDPNDDNISVEIAERNKSSDLDLKCTNSKVQQPSEDTPPGCCGKVNPKCEPLGSWFLLVRIVLYHALIGINYSCFGVLYVEYTEYFRSSKADLGWIISIQTSLASLLGIFVSRPIEQFGCAPIACLGSALFVSGLALSSLAPSAPVLYITQGAITGVGLCIACLPSAVILQQYFEAHRVMATAMAMLGFSLGHVMGPPLTELLLEEYGWRGTVLLLAAILAHMIPLGQTLWHPTLGSKIEDKRTDKASEKQKTWIKGCRRLVKWNLLTHRPFLLFNLGCVLHSFYIVGIVQHLPGYAVYQGIHLQQAALLTTVMFFTNMMVKLLVALVADTLKVQPLLQYTVWSLPSILSVVIILCIKGFSGLLVGCILAGIHLGVTLSLVWVVLVRLEGPELISHTLPINNFMLGLIKLIPAPFFGWLYDLSGLYELPFIVMGGMATLATMLFASVTVMERLRVSKQISNIEHNESQGTYHAKCAEEDTVQEI